MLEAVLKLFYHIGLFVINQWVQDMYVLQNSSNINLKTRFVVGVETNEDWSDGLAHHPVAPLVRAIWLQIKNVGEVYKQYKHCYVLCPTVTYLTKQWCRYYE